MLCVCVCACVCLRARACSVCRRGGWRWVVVVAADQRTAEEGGRWGCRPSRVDRPLKVKSHSK